MLQGMPETTTCVIGAGVVLMVGAMVNMFYLQREQRAAHCKKNGGLWIINRKVYDLMPFMERHPGGRYILEATQGRDCSAMFYSYHATTSQPVDVMLEKFYVRKAKPEECVDSKLWDFGEMPFYRELQLEVQKAIGNKRTSFKASYAHLFQYLVCTCAMVVSLKGWLLGGTLSGIVFGVMIWFCSGDILHASTHYAVFSSPNINLMTGFLFGWLHHVPSMWVRQHVLGHHAYTNVPGLDPDLDHFRQFSAWWGGWRLTDTQQPHVSYTNWRLSLLPIMFITGIGPLFGESISALLSGHYMWHIPLKMTKGESAVTVLQLSLAIAMGIALPYYLNGSTLHVLLPYSVHGMIYFGFSSVSHSNTESQSGVLDSGDPILSSDRYITRVEKVDGEAGSSEPKASPRPKEQNDKSKKAPQQQPQRPPPLKRKEWAAHQVETSKGDFAQTSIFWGLAGLGLNNQAFHHVFPGIHPCHYYYLAPVLQKVCEKHGVDCHWHRTFFDAFASHLRHVGRLNDSVKLVSTASAEEEVADVIAVVAESRRPPFGLCVSYL